MRNIDDLLKSLTLEEKASLTSGAAFWNTQEIPGRVDSIMMTDGPHGLRKRANEEDAIGMNDSVPATCFPSSATVCNSWDVDLMEKIGVALGQECLANDVQVLLGPGTNIKRSPLCGRNFEYFSEDPYLSSHMAAAHVTGVQSQGVGSCVKHFAVNNQETNRFTVNAVVDERALREIYLASFETVIKEAKPWMVMGAYNKVNGTHCCEHEVLLKDILRGEWGYDGVVVSDWSAAGDAVKGVKATFDLRMPGPAPAADAQIVAAVKSGALSEEQLDETVKRLLTLVEKGIESRQIVSPSRFVEHHDLARQAAAESAVLLKNSQSVLPLSPASKVAMIGGFAKNVRYQGGGSSNVNATNVPTLPEAFAELQPDVAFSFARGFRVKKDEIDEDYVAEALQNAKAADVILLNLGLPYRKESEGFDRKDLQLPENQLDLLNRLSELGKPLIVLLYMGAPIEMPWLFQANAVLAMYTGGQAVAEAAVELLYGDAVPCGKLSETFPLVLENTPASLNFPQKKTAVYEEGIYVGYRYYDKKQLEVRFPFGYGLSYTTFAYDNLKISASKATDVDPITVTVDITNIGSVPGKEIVQLYVRDVASTVSRPEQELKGFTKLELQPGETKTAVFTLNKRSFATYDTDMHDWLVESGDFEIMIGASSRDIRSSKILSITGTTEKREIFTADTPLRNFMANPTARALLNGFLDFGTMGEMNKMTAEEKESILNDEDNVRELAVDEAEIGGDMPVGKIVDFSNGALTEKALETMFVILNEQKVRTPG